MVARRSSLLSLSALFVGFAALAGCFAESGSVEADATASAASAATLDDAFAENVLAGRCDVVVDGVRQKTSGPRGSCPTTLSSLMDLLETFADPDAEGRESDPRSPHVFVVSEKGDRPNEKDTGFRFVIALRDKKDNPFYVAKAGDKNLGEGGVEAMGFSPSLQAFAYYKLEGDGPNATWTRKGDGTQVKSVTDGKSPAFECVRCHTTGAPLMKEIHDSWGNWSSLWFTMSPPNAPNPLVDRLFGVVEPANFLEPEIINGIHKHSKGRVNRAIKEGELKGVLSQLMCEIGEPSLIGASATNDTRMGRVKTTSTMLPTGILINPLLVPPETRHVDEADLGVELGLEQSLSLRVPSLSAVGQGIDPEAYTKAVLDNGQTVGGKPGDTLFPMSSPEKSYADLDAVQELLRRKLIDKEIVADILMTDYTVSAFSKVRCDLAQTMPETWKTPAELKTMWAKALERSSLRGAKGLKSRLEKSDLEQHEAKLEAFAASCKARPARELTVDALRIVSQRRVEFAARYGALIESPWLIPVDGLGSRADAIRLSSACTIEDAAKKFDGED